MITVDAERSIAYRWHVLASALLVQTTISVVTQAFPALVPFAETDLGLSPAEVGLFATILNLGTMVALLPTGWVVDVIGERRVLVIGGVCTGVFAIVAALAPTFMWIVPLLVIVGVATASPTPAGSTAIMNAFGRRDRGFVMSIRQTGIPLGGALAALLLPPIAFAAGWRVALVVAASLAIGGALCGGSLLRRMPRRSERTAYFRVPLRSVATWPATFLGLTGMVLAFGQFALLSYIALYLLDTFNVPIGVGSLFLVVANIGGVVGRVAWGSASDRLFGGRRYAPLKVLSICAAAEFLVLAVMPATTPLAVMLVLVFLQGATVVGWNGVYVTALSEIAPVAMRARTVAYGMTISQVGIFGGPFCFGLLIEVSHAYRIAWVVVSGAMLTAVVLVGRASSFRRSPRDA